MRIVGVEGGLPSELRKGLAAGGVEGRGIHSESPQPTGLEHSGRVGPGVKNASSEPVTGHRECKSGRGPPVKLPFLPAESSSPLSAFFGP